MRVKAHNLPSFWHESTQNPYTFEARLQSPLKEELCKMSYESNANPQRDQMMRVCPKPLFKRMAANGFQELRALLRGLCRDLKTIEGNVINNKVTPENIFLNKDYRLCLGEWGYSSFRDCFNTQTTTFESRVEPFLRGN